ncbi:hypothetical protein GGF46_003650 [Coemansia sp. RSA 552]|nr:hypothetical protein GGF46_003650 [Coemansia sp. RSA 552]
MSPADGMGIYGHDGWYSEGDSVESMNPAHRLASSLPVYEPIDMARNVPQPPSEPRSGAYIRATQPILPDARMLAPMASLADAYGGGPGGHNELSNRELRFTIENHMLVEQHRYLIRDLGHARSAISALKQVVQTKEDRYEHYEMTHMELNCRVALLESVLTPEQRQLLACMPYTSTQSDGQASSTNLADSAHSSQVPPPQQQYMEYGADTSGSFPGSAESLAMPLPTTSIPTVTQQGSVPDVKGTTNRPLSGYATGYTFSGKPVHQLPRVFSGDYSSADVHAMENSVEALASAITAMPHDADSVDDIIARKVADGDAPGPTCDCEHAVPEGPPRTDESQQRRSGRTEPKRRSRFLSVLRKSGLASSLSASGNIPGAAKQKRRSVSLGNGGKAKQQQQSRVEDGGPASYQLGAQSAQFGRQRADSEESMAASCPTLIPGIPRAKPSQKTQRLSSVESVGSNGRYPSSLGLGPTSDNSRMSSLQGGNGGRKISQRFSLTAEPRRSTSAPSRPHTMRVTSRRSWISQFFGGGSSSSNNSLEFVEPPTCEERELDSASDDASDELAGGPKVQRRRVMTHSTDEISRFLDKLRFEEPPPRGGISNGALEDVVDVSGEDEERASRASLSVAEVRQQTLDALNGTTRSNSELPPGCDSDIDNEPKTEPSDTCTHEASVRDPAGSRWRSHDTSVATIKRLNRAKSASNAPATGLGVCTAPSRGAAPEFGTSGESIPTESVVSAAHTASESYGRRPQSWAQSTRDEASPHNSKRWAPAFWAPPPNARSPDEPESGGHPHSDDLCFYSPEGSLGVHSRRGSRGRSSSPWELVRLSDTHKSPLSSSPSPPALGFFEDLTVPDSDELSMATRRSLSLRNSFTQADPLPESDDLGEEVMERAAIEVPRPLQAELGQELGRRPSVPLQNIALTRLTSSVQSKRRSLLRQFTPSRVANKPGVSRNMADFTDQGELEKTESSEGAADSPPAVSPQHLEPNLTSTSPRPSKRWWSSMLG